MSSVLHSKIIAYVYHAAVKDILIQQDCDGKWGKWIAKLQEYYVEIRLTQLVKIQGLARLMAEPIPGSTP